MPVTSETTNPEACQKRDMMRQQLYLSPVKCLITLLLLSALCRSSAAQTGPVKNQILAGYQVRVERKCSFFKINFNHRIRYVSHFPISSGTELRIMLRPIDPRRFDLDGGLEREALRPPQDRRIGVKGIQYESAVAEGPTLTIFFDRPVNFDAAGGADFQSLVFSVTDTRNGKACKPLYPGRNADGWETTVTRGPPPSDKVVARRNSTPVVIPDVPVIPNVPTATPVAVTPATASAPNSVSGPTKVVAGTRVGAGSGSSESEAAAGALIAEARSALVQGKLELAIARLKKAVELPENRRTPEARELLGVAYQKDRQLAAAKSVYEDYVRRYPNGEGSEGVRQRLQAMETADAPSVRTLRVPSIGPTAIDGTVQSPGSAQTAGGQSYWSISGSLSTFFISDDTRSVMRDPTLALNLNSTKDDHQVHQNTLLTSIDLGAVWGNADVKNKFRFSATEEHRPGMDEPDIAGVSALYLDTTIKDWDTTFRIGRQTRNTGGILGRFDGAVITYQVNPLFGITAVGGSPVEYRYDLPFKDDRYFFGASVNFGPYNGLDASVYAIEQMDRTVVDRQAVGTELRYNDATKSAFLNLDYDTHFNELDAAIFTGTWTLPDKSIVRVGGDYRKAPYLTAWNAIRGQPYGTLYDLLKAYTLSEAQQMAIDRTATYQSSTIGYSRPLTDNLQLNLDFTQAHIDGTIASYNVYGTPDMGDEFYYSAQLVGTSLFRRNDLYTAAFRYSDLKESHNYAVNLSTRYPITENLWVQPRFVAGVTEGKNTAFSEYTILPSLLISYVLWKDWNFEVEAGERWTWITQGGTRSSETEFVITAGFRLDFYADAQTCLTPSVFCTRASQAAKQ
jgi:hypothetical protein